MSAPTLARSHGSRVQHLLMPGSVRITRCGLDATLMARWAPADVPTDSKHRPTCAACRVN